jgi:heme/copper-type cytochrome/quinol oxidase subunit 2
LPPAIHPQTAFNPRSDYAQEGLSLFELTIYAGVAVGVLVEAILIFAAIRYRRRSGDRLPPQIHGNTLIEFIWTTIPVLIVGWILFVTLPVIFSTQAPAPTGSMLVKVTGHQFWWEFERDHGQRAASTGGSHREPAVALGGRDPQLLGARPGRQTRRVPRSHQLHLDDA